VPTATQLPDVLEVRGSLAFVARERGQDDIWVVPVGGAQPIRLINSPEDDRDPAWSPDGLRLAFASRRNGNWDIFYYDLLTGETTQLTFGLSFQARPVWSPDGTLVAYESYQPGNLDIFVTSIDGTVEPQQLPSSTDAAEFSPAWAPDPGRRIAYTAWVDGNQDIFVFDLDSRQALNVTNTPDLNEDYAAWSPDGRMLAYSAVDGGIEKVFVRSYEDRNAPAQVFRRGRMPFWSPDGAALVFAVETPQSTQFVVEAFGGGGVATSLTAINLPASRPVWTEAPLPAALVNAGSAELNADPLYVEQVEGTGGDPPYRLGTITNLTNPELIANLNERVNDSFNALRQRVLQAAGLDFLGELDAALWDLNRRPQPGEPNRNWHRTGRAFSFNRDLLLAGFPRPIEIVREDTDLDTFWRVYVRVEDDAQSGQLGEPLRDIPWEFVDATSGDVEAYDRGGRLKPAIPPGYYVDVTQLALDYGWLWFPAGDDWRANVNTINYWMFYKPDGLSWYDAMRELYTVGELGGFNPTPTPQPVVPTDQSEGG
jgi:Tol biopolymer transport system component